MTSPNELYSNEFILHVRNLCPRKRISYLMLQQFSAMLWNLEPSGLLICWDVWRPSGSLGIDPGCVLWGACPSLLSYLQIKKNMLWNLFEEISIKCKGKDSSFQRSIICSINLRARQFRGSRVFLFNNLKLNVKHFPDTGTLFKNCLPMSNTITEMGKQLIWLT